jgi:hypothetical protein
MLLSCMPCTCQVKRSKSYRTMLIRPGCALQGEHGTGRNMAPFVEVEWGRQATAIMQRIKDAFDPHSLLNPGVILTQVLPKQHGCIHRTCCDLARHVHTRGQYLLSR